MAGFVLDSLKLGRNSMIRENQKITEQVDGLIQDIEERGVVAITERSSEIKVTFMKLCICTTPDVASVLGKAAQAVDGETEVELIEIYRSDNYRWLLRDADGQWYMCFHTNWTAIDGQMLEPKRDRMYRYSPKAKQHKKLVESWRASSAMFQTALSIAQ